MNRKIFLDELAIFTIGFPFVLFKLLLGFIFFKIFGAPANLIVGSLLILWAIIDFFINGLNLIFLVFKNRYLTDACLLTIIFAGCRAKISDKDAGKEFGTAIDAMLSCTIVAIIVGGDLFDYMSDLESILWSVSVVVNVMGAGITRILLSVGVGDGS